MNDHWSRKSCKVASRDRECSWEQFAKCIICPHCPHCPPGRIHSGLLVCLVLECAKVVLAFGLCPLHSLCLALPHLELPTSQAARLLVTLSSDEKWHNQRALPSPATGLAPLYLQVTAPLRLGTDCCLKVASCFMVKVFHQFPLPVEVRFRRWWAGLS